MLSRNENEKPSGPRHGLSEVSKHKLERSMELTSLLEFTEPAVILFVPASDQQWAISFVSSCVFII